MTHGAIQRLSDRQPIAERDGNPSLGFQRTWQEIVEHLEQMEEDLDDKQDGDPLLTSIAGLTFGADNYIYGTGSDTAAAGTITSVARTLVAQTTQALMRSTGLGLGTAAVKNTGTSGDAVPLLDGANTWSAQQTAPTLRLTDTTDVSLSSTGHAFQIGASSGANIATDNNEIMARNNGATSTLFLNTDGGLVQIGSGGLDVDGNITADGASHTFGVAGINTGVLVQGTDAAVRFKDTAATGTSIGTLGISMRGSDDVTVAFIVRVAGSANLVYENSSNHVFTVGGSTIATVSTAGLDVVGLSRCDSFRIDQTPTAATPTPTHTITISCNGTNYRIPCVV